MLVKSQVVWIMVYGNGMGEYAGAAGAFCKATVPRKPCVRGEGPDVIFFRHIRFVHIYVFILFRFPISIIRLSLFQPRIL
jgi:hypothetical protein